MLLGCGDDQDFKNDNFVVEAFIVANEPVNNVKVKMLTSINEIDPDFEPYSEAEVTISEDENVFNLTYNVENGLYSYEGTGLDIEVGVEYDIQVKVASRLANSSTIVPDVPTGLSIPQTTLIVPQIVLSPDLPDLIGELFRDERITLTWDERPGQHYFVVIENRVGELDPIIPEWIPPEPRALLSSFRFISEPSETVSFDIIGVALETYGPHIAKVYSVNDEYVELFNNLEQDSRDLNEPPSNIQNALGIFTAFAVDSVEFEVARE